VASKGIEGENDDAIQSVIGQSSLSLSYHTLEVTGNDLTSHQINSFIFFNIFKLF